MKAWRVRNAGGSRMGRHGFVWGCYAPIPAQFPCQVVASRLNALPGRLPAVRCTESAQRLSGFEHNQPRQPALLGGTCPPAFAPLRQRARAPGRVGISPASVETNGPSNGTFGSGGKKPPRSPFLYRSATTTPFAGSTAVRPGRHTPVLFFNHRKTFKHENKRFMDFPAGNCRGIARLREQ